MSSPHDVLAYWFGTSDDPETVFVDCAPKWFRGGEAVDQEIRERFLPDIEAAVAGKLDWLGEPRSNVALVILLDQFTRNVYRGTPRAFSGDARALAAAEHAIAHHDGQLKFHHRIFLRIPLEHAEDLAVQDRGVALLEAMVEEGEYVEKAKMYLDYSQRHRDIIARFGRFPHRNEILGRESTPKEVEFLKQPGSSF